MGNQVPFYEALDVFSEVKRFRIIQVEPDLFDIVCWRLCYG